MEADRKVGEMLPRMKNGRHLHLNFEKVPLWAQEHGLLTKLAPVCNEAFVDFGRTDLCSDIVFFLHLLIEFPYFMK